MTIAQDILDTCQNDYWTINCVAEQFATDIDDDWNNGRTTFTFGDGSQIVMSGPIVAAR